MYYFNSKKLGELDFVVEYQGNVLPIEVKSGKGYTRHHALDNVLETPRYGIEEAIVFCNENVQKKGNIVYMPVYMAGMLKKEIQKEYVYSLDLGILQE